MAMQVSTDVHETVTLIEASPEFQRFNAQNPHHYLVHAFASTKSLDGDSPALELGYYGKETDMITVFTSLPIAAREPEEVFKKEGVLAQLDIAAVRIGLSEALRNAERLRSAHYPQHNVMQCFCILQQHDWPVWNITLVLGSLNMLNMKIDAMTGEALSRELQNIMSLRAEE
jgi:hypothetical protein